MRQCVTSLQHFKHNYTARLLFWCLLSLCRFSGWLVKIESSLVHQQVPSIWHSAPSPQTCDSRLLLFASDIQCDCLSCDSVVWKWWFGEIFVIDCGTIILPSTITHCFANACRFAYRKGSRSVRRTVLGKEGVLLFQDLLGCRLDNRW